MQNLFVNYKKFVIAIGIASLVSLAAEGHADVVSEHAGASDPTTQGWTVQQYVVAGGTAATAGPGATENGIDYWPIFSGANSNCLFVADAVVATSFIDPAGWTATMKVRVATVGGLTESITMKVNDATDRWIIQLNANGVEMRGAATKLLSNIDVTADFHTYQILYDPTASTTQVGVYLDGVLLGHYTRALAFDATESQSNRVAFGDGAASGAETPESHWNQVRFETGQHIVHEDLPHSRSQRSGVGPGLYAIATAEPDPMRDRDGMLAWPFREIDNTSDAGNWVTVVARAAGIN